MAWQWVAPGWGVWLAFPMLAVFASIGAVVGIWPGQPSLVDSIAVAAIVALALWGAMQFVILVSALILMPIAWFGRKFGSSRRTRS